jgi:hypothetical protein
VFDNLLFKKMHRATSRASLLVCSSFFEAHDHMSSMPAPGDAAMICCCWRVAVGLVFLGGGVKPSIYFGHFWLWLSEICWLLPALIGNKFILGVFSRPWLAP